MCGIAGVYFFGARAVDPDVLHRMSAALRHRGPDEEGFYSGPCAALAHRRLKIIDLSKAAAQPMSDETGRYRLIFNGEIYNFRELRAGLSGYRFFSQSDTEVILRLFQERRRGAWERLRGMFALALIDEQTRELFLARDAAGIKPLYCYRDAEKLVFASELKGLLASGLVPSEADHASLAEYLRFGYFPGRATPFRNVFKILPGEDAVVSEEGIEFKRFWKLRDFIARPQHATALPETLETLLQRSVEGHMISDVPLGAFLSGGVDSSLLVALMSRTASAPVKTFTVGFTRMGYYDERSQAARIAKHFHTDHHEFAVDQRVEELIPELVSVFDEPFADSSSIPTLCLARLARRDVTVALSGTGGDEVFGGSRKYMASYWMQWYAALPAPVRATLMKTASFLPGSRRSLWRERALLLQRFTGLNPQDRPEIQMNQIFMDPEIDQILPGVSLQRENPSFLPLDATAAENLMLFDFEYYLPDDLLVKEDRCTMAFGLEARVPFLDRDVVEFMATVPLKHKVTGTAAKRLFKKVASRYLPEWVLRRPKHGFGSPVAEWLRSDLRNLARDALLDPNARLKSPLAAAILNEHLAGKTDHSRKLWTLLMLELWMRALSRDFRF